MAVQAESCCSYLTGGSGSRCIGLRMPRALGAMTIDPGEPVPSGGEGKEGDEWG